MPADLSKIPAALRMGLEAVMLNHSKKTLAHSRQSNARYEEMMLAGDGKTPPASPLPVEGDEMMVFGDYTVNQTTTPPLPPPQPSPLRKLIGPALVAASLLGGGALGALFVRPTPEPEKPTTPPPTQQPSAVDTDTMFELRLGPPERSGTDAG